VVEARAVSVGISWKFWKTKPTLALRTRALPSSSRRSSVSPASSTEPPEARSRPAHRPRSVVLPLPLGPTMAMLSPGPISKLASWRTVRGPAAVG
jgi:hypothetical protein